MSNDPRGEGVVVADYVVSKMQGEGMSPAEAVEVLTAYVAKQVEHMAREGASREDLIAWADAVQVAFDSRLADLIGANE